MRLSLSPISLHTSSLIEGHKKFKCPSFEQARQTAVFPVPGGPYKRNPVGGSTPKCWKRYVPTSCAAKPSNEHTAVRSTPRDSSSGGGIPRSHQGRVWPPPAGLQRVSAGDGVEQPAVTEQEHCCWGEAAQLPKGRKHNTAARKRSGHNGEAQSSRSGSGRPK